MSNVKPGDIWDVSFSGVRPVRVEVKQACVDAASSTSELKWLCVAVSEPLFGRREPGYPYLFSEDVFATSRRVTRASNRGVHAAGVAARARPVSRRS